MLGPSSAVKFRAVGQIGILCHIKLSIIHMNKDWWFIPVESLVGSVVSIPVVKCVVLVFWYVLVEDTSGMTVVTILTAV